MEFRWHFAGDQRITSWPDKTIEHQARRLLADLFPAVGASHLDADRAQLLPNECRRGIDEKNHNLPLISFLISLSVLSQRAVLEHGYVFIDSSITSGYLNVVGATVPLDTMTSNLLLSLPSEILHNIFSHIDPTDLLSVQLCSHYANDFVKSDRLLYRELYLQLVDDPRSGEDWYAGPEPDWPALLHTHLRIRKILESKNVDAKKREVDFVTGAVLKLLKTAKKGPGASRNRDFLAGYFGQSGQVNREVFICGSTLYRWAEHETWPHQTCCEARQGQDRYISEDYVASARAFGRVIPPPDLCTREIPTDRDELCKRQLFAKLHSLYGVPVQQVRRGVRSTPLPKYALRSDTAPIHPFVRSKVYDLRQHTERSLWGPFLDDGSQDVDWEKIEAIMLMLNHNLSNFAQAHEVFNDNAVPDWSKPFSGTFAYSYVSRRVNIPLQPALPLQSGDPYNITGTWMRIVCFLDYTELYNFNFGGEQPASNQPRLPLDTEEATRLITMRLQITKIEKPGKDDGKDLPVVHFKGTSASVRPSWDPNANSQIKGTVRLTPQGEVRWTTWSLFHGEERWRSEGIQVGGIQSARGVIGFWFDKDYEVYGPAGPTAFWKSHDGVEAVSSSNFLNHGLHALHMPL